MHPQARRPGGWTLSAGPLPVLLGLLLLLGGCAKQAAKPPPAPPPPPPAPPAVQQPRLHAGWSFHNNGDACLAIAASGRTRLVIAVHRKQPIRLSVTVPYATSDVPVARFHGPAGAWTVHGWRAGAHEVVFPLGQDMDSLSRVLMLLSGGVLDLASPEKNLPIFTLSASGPDGQRWFSCARRLVI